MLQYITIQASYNIIYPVFEVVDLVFVSTSLGADGVPGLGHPFHHTMEPMPGGCQRWGHDDEPMESDGQLTLFWGSPGGFMIEIGFRIAKMFR